MALGSVVVGEGEAVGVNDGAAVDEAGMDCPVVLLFGRAGAVCGAGTAGAPERAVSRLERFGAPDDAGWTAPVGFAAPTFGTAALPVSTVEVTVTEVLDVEVPAPAGAGEPG